ncbi:hypothetical protein [Kitasatospora sp. GP82]|nr:hypothetical protein [Kitasatospora sp. GP82]MDH6127568.1 hypothetical protein [Kitasatospora sp. GP82]
MRTMTDRLSARDSAGPVAGRPKGSGPRGDPGGAEHDPYEHSMSRRRAP